MTETERIYRQKITEKEKPPLMERVFTPWGICQWDGENWEDENYHTVSPEWWLEEVKEPVHVLTPEQLKEEMISFKVFCVGHYIETITSSDGVFRHRFRTDEELYDLYLKSKQS